MKHTITTLIIILLQFAVVYNLSEPTNIEPISFMLGNLQVLGVFVIFHLIDKQVA